MKSKKIAGLIGVFLLSLTSLLQCSKEDKAPVIVQPTQTYFIKFKANGVQKLFEEGNPGYQSCGQCACSVIPPLNTTKHANLSICQDNNNYITAANIESWNNKKILWVNTSLPYSNFGFVEDNISYQSDFAADQAGSEVNITKVESDGLFVAKKMYKVTGNFKCKVAKSDGTLPLTITEGQFVVRYSED